jgi:hypothetical protein
MEVSPPQPRARYYFPQQPGRKSKFFAHGKLIAHDSISAISQPAIETPLTTGDHSATKITIPHPATSGSFSHLLSKDLHGRLLETENLWKTYVTQGAQPKQTAAPDASSFNTVTPSDAQNDQDDFLPCLPLVFRPRLVIPDPSAQNKRMAISDTVLRLQTGLVERVPDPDAAEYDIVSPLPEYDIISPVLAHDIISPVTAISSANYWEELFTPPQSNTDIESINESDDDDEDDESFYESRYYAQ